MDEKISRETLDRYVGNTKRLVESLRSESSTVQRLVEIVPNLANQALANFDGLLSEIQRLQNVEESIHEHRRAADRTVARIAAAAETYIASLNRGPANARKRARALKSLRMLISTGGEPPHSIGEGYGSLLNGLRDLARSESWGAIALGQETSPGNFVTSSRVLWNGGMERHPRELARAILREVFEVDPDRDDDTNLYDEYEDD